MSKVRIVIRTFDGVKHNWALAKGKNDPAGIYYLRIGGRYTTAGATYDEALVAKIRAERKLTAASVGAVIQEEISHAHKITDVINAYLDDLRLNRRPTKSIVSKETELKEFAAFCGKTYIEQITRVDLITFRNCLMDAGYAPVTVLNKLMSVSTWLKKNTIVSITGLLKSEDWPEKKDTTPHPYTHAGGVTHINYRRTFSNPETIPTKIR